VFAAPALRFGFVGLHQLGRALRGLPSSSLVRSCDRPEILSCGSAFFRVLAESPCPPPRAPLLGFQPPRLRAFSAQRAGTFAARRRPARGVSSCVGRRATCPPEGLACRRRWALARHLSCALPSAAEVACVGAPESASPSEVASSCEAAIRLSRFLVRRRTARRRRHYARRDRVASASPVVHSCGRVRLRGDPAWLSREQEASKVFPTAIHSLWTAPAAASDDAHSRRRLRAKPRPARLSAIHSRRPAWRAGHRDRHDANPRVAASCAIERGWSAPPGHAPRRWTRVPFGLIVPVCRFPSTRSCRAPRK